MMSTGNYSKFSTFSLKKRCYIMQAQRNVPLLDSEIRELSETSVALTNWLARNSYGDIAVLSQPYSDPDGATTHRNNAFGCGPVDSPVEGSFDFKVYGGRNGAGRNDSPAVMYLKGWYIFLNSDILYTDQSENVDSALSDIIKEYPGESLPDEDAPVSEKLKYALRSDTYTKTYAPQLRSGYVGQYDLIYLEVTFDEVTGLDRGGSSYVDPSLVDPTLGSQTANRIRATLNIVVKEDWGKENADDVYWTKANGFTGMIFSHPMFEDGKYPGSGVSYIRAPLAFVKRSASNSYPTAGEFVDLLERYNRRVYTPKEISFQLRHGGFTQRDVDAGVPGAVIDETWDAKGQNKGVKTEALNTDSVTPRILEKKGQFKIKSQVIGSVEKKEQPLTESDPEKLQDGELVVSAVYAEKSFIRGNLTTKVAQARGWLEGALQVVDITATSLPGQVWHTSAEKLDDSEEDAKGSAWVQRYHMDEGMSSETVSELDYMGRLAIGRGFDTDHNYFLDVQGASRFTGALMASGAFHLQGDQSISGNLSIDKDLSVSGDTLLKNTLTVSGGTFLTDTLTVTEGTSLKGGLEVLGGTTTGTLNVTGTSTFTGSTTIFNDVIIEGTLTATAPAAGGSEQQVVTVGYLSSYTTNTVGNYLPLAGGTLSGNLVFSNPPYSTFRGVTGYMGDSDWWRVGGSAPETDNGRFEIATFVNGKEPIYVRQYEGGTVKKNLILLDTDGTTFIPGKLTANNGVEVFGAPLEAKAGIFLQGSFYTGGNCAGSAGQVLTAQETGSPLWADPTGVTSWSNLSSALRKQLGSMVTGTFYSRYEDWSSNTNWKVLHKNKNNLEVFLQNSTSPIPAADYGSNYHVVSCVIGNGYIRDFAVTVAMTRGGTINPGVRVTLLKSNTALLETKTTLYDNGNDVTGRLIFTNKEKQLLNSGSLLKIRFELTDDGDFASECKVLSVQVHMTLTAAPYDSEIVE